MRRLLMRQNSEPMRRYCNQSACTDILWQRPNRRTAGGWVSQEDCQAQEMRTANDPGAFLAAVQPAPRYRPMPSSATILNTPRPRNASGFVCRLILRTSRGKRTISPIPMMLQCFRKSRNVVTRGAHVPACGCRHHGLASTFSECPVELVAVVEGKVVANKGLATIFVDSL